MVLVFFSCNLVSIHKALQGVIHYTQFLFSPLLSSVLSPLLVSYLFNSSPFPTFLLLHFLSSHSFSLWLLSSSNTSPLLCSVLPSSALLCSLLLSSAFLSFPLLSSHTSLDRAIFCLSSSLQTSTVFYPGETLFIECVCLCTHTVQVAI